MIYVVVVVVINKHYEAFRSNSKQHRVYCIV